LILFGLVHPAVEEIETHWYNPQPGSIPEIVRTVPQRVRSCRKAPALIEQCDSEIKYKMKPK